MSRRLPPKLERLRAQLLAAAPDGKLPPLNGPGVGFAALATGALVGSLHPEPQVGALLSHIVGAGMAGAVARAAERQLLRSSVDRGVWRRAWSLARRLRSIGVTSSHLGPYVDPDAAPGLVLLYALDVAHRSPPWWREEPAPPSRRLPPRFRPPGVARYPAATLRALDAAAAGLGDA